jgi:membrane-associated phospholipid phosphatase
MRNKAVLPFLAMAVVLALPALWAVAVSTHLALHQQIHQWHPAWADQAMPWITEGANGWVPAVLAIALLWHSWRAFLMMGLSTLLGSLAVQSLKHFIFSHVDRPVAFLAEMPGLHLVPGVELHSSFSFPSGHSTTAFGMCFALAVVWGKRGPAVGLAIIAAILAFSRVYLSQHFTEDAVAGAALGTFIGWLVYRRLYHGPLSLHTGLDRSPVRRYSSE